MAFVVQMSSFDFSDAQLIVTATMHPAIVIALNSLKLILFTFHYLIF